MPLWGRRKPKGKPGKMEVTSGDGQTGQHVHVWQEVGRRQARGRFKGQDYVFWHCYGRKCPNPDKMTIE